jgi:hypothetical protein
MIGLRIILALMFGSLASIAPVAREALPQENHKKLTGPQIRAAVAGMEISDNVHWRDVYERSGALRSSMGQTRLGKWSIEGDALCLDLKPPDAGCYEVWRSGKNIELRPTGAGVPLEAVIQLPTDRK